MSSLRFLEALLGSEELFIKGEMLPKLNSQRNEMTAKQQPTDNRINIGPV